MDDQTSNSTNSSAEQLHSFKSQHCMSECRYGWTHTPWMVAASLLPPSAGREKKRHLSCSFKANNKGISKYSKSQLSVHLHMLWARLKASTAGSRATRIFVTQKCSPPNKGFCHCCFKVIYLQENVGFEQGFSTGL